MMYVLRYEVIGDEIKLSLPASTHSFPPPPPAFEGKPLPTPEHLPIYPYTILGELPSRATSFAERARYEEPMRQDWVGANNADESAVS